MENTLKNVLIIVCFLLCILLLGLWMGWIGPQYAHAYALEKNKQNIKDAYLNVIHRVWIDKPDYVEDVLWETDEFLHLDALLEGDWEDTFDFWSEKDSIDYYTNWSYDPICIDKLSIPTKPDKSSKPVPVIELTPAHNGKN